MTDPLLYHRRYQDLAGAAAWTIRELAETDWPCLCGEPAHPSHGHAGDEPSGLPDCPGHYQPDLDRACQRCDAAGVIWHNSRGETDCPACDGRGWTL